MEDSAAEVDIKELLGEVDAEIDRVGSAVDPAGDDEPEVEPYATRLHSLRSATSAMAAYEADETDI
jgi:hypothetical protein